MGYSEDCDAGREAQREAEAARRDCRDLQYEMNQLRQDHDQELRELREELRQEIRDVWTRLREVPETV